MRVVVIPGNGHGNCLFQSCGYHLNVDHVTLRMQVAKSIEYNPDIKISGLTLDEWFEAAGHDRLEYARNISNWGHWGTAVDLTIISLLYKRCIRVMQRGHERFYQIAEYFPEFGNVFYVLFTGNHYEPLEE